MRRKGLQKAVAQASDDELGDAYAMIQYRRKEFNLHEVAFTIALLRSSRGMSHFAKSRRQPRIIGTDGSENEEGSPFANGAHTAEGTGRAPNEHPHTLPSIYTYDQAAVQDCVDQCVMSGAVHPDDNIVRRNSSDSLVCHDDLQTMFDNMQWKIVRRKDIAAMNLLDDPSILNMIQDEWRTTVLGVGLAWLDQLLYGDSATDITFLGGLEKRGGVVHKIGDVEYPEDIVATMSPDHECYDKQYWAALAEQDGMGVVWREVFPDEYPEDVAMRDG